MENLSSISFPEFLQAIQENHGNRFTYCIEYDEFGVVFDKQCKKYYAYNIDDESFSEAECIACLSYSAIHDIQISEDDVGIVLGKLFECDVCGEMISDDGIQYLWFKEV